MCVNNFHLKIKSTGTHYNINRDYNPTTGRYIQSDPIGLDGGFSTFAYVNGNPVMVVDLEGLFGGSAEASEPISDDDPCESDRLALANYAFSLKGNLSFSYASRTCASNLCFPNNSWKCNLFVYHIISHVLGSNKAPRLSASSVWTANTWARSSAQNSNWKIVSEPKKGDVAAKPASRGSGHVGIFSHYQWGGAYVMAANTYSVDWSQSHINNTSILVYRRYIGCK